MKLSSRGEYGLRLMAELALAYGEGPVPLGQIAEREDISLAYLEQLIAVLRRSGLVSSVRGAKGGYALANAPQQIRVGDVVRALEGPIAPVTCLANDRQGPSCSRQGRCSSRVVWERLRDSMVKALDSVTLADLCQAREPELTAG